MLIILESGGFKSGGINFDAKIRRNSTNAADLFHAHIGGIDAFSRALIIGDKIYSRVSINNCVKKDMRFMIMVKAKHLKKAKYLEKI